MFVNASAVPEKNAGKCYMPMYMDDQQVEKIPEISAVEAACAKSAFATVATATLRKERPSRRGAAKHELSTPLTKLAQGTRVEHISRFDPSTPRLVHSVIQNVEVARMMGVGRDD